MEIQKLKISDADRKLLSDFIGEDIGNEIDFNRLMPVVEKCKELQEGKWHHKSRSLYLDVCTGIYEVKIKETWIAVIEFIKWHNQNQ